jgi:hypothetical protein
MERRFDYHALSVPITQGSSALGWRSHSLCPVRVSVSCGSAWATRSPPSGSVSPLLTQVLAFVAAHEPLLDVLADEHSLVHADFSLDNLLVQQMAGRWSVAAVLEWDRGFAADFLRIPPHGGHPCLRLVS